MQIALLVVVLPNYSNYSLYIPLGTILGIGLSAPFIRLFIDKILSIAYNLLLVWLLVIAIT